MISPVRREATIVIFVTTLLDSADIIMGGYEIRIFVGRSRPSMAFAAFEHPCSSERGGGVRKTGVYTPVHEDFEYDANEAIRRKDGFQRCP